MKPVLLASFFVVTVVGLAAARPTNASGRIFSIELAVDMVSGQTRSMRATIDADASVADRTEIWTSSDTSTVRVDQRGTLVAIRAGQAYVTVKAHADTAYRAGFWVYVNGRGR